MFINCIRRFGRCRMLVEGFETPLLRIGCFLALLGVEPLGQPSAMSECQPTTPTAQLVKASMLEHEVFHACIMILAGAIQLS